MPGVWQPTTGAMLGTAVGAIRIDTSDVTRAGTVTKASAKEIADAFNKVDAAAKKTKPSLVGFANDIGKIRGEIAALSLGAGVLAGIGLNVAGSMESAAIQFAGLTGGIKEANALMADLRKKGLAAGIPFNDMLKASKQLLPTLEGNTGALDTYMRLAQRVAVLNPAEGIAGAVFAINEALASGGTDLVSLSERFQVSRFKLREALAATGGDFAAALDMVLNKMGITQQTADDMGKGFQASLARAKDSAGQLLGAGFGPLLDVITPLLNRATEFMVSLQETNPELLTMAAGVTAIVAAGGPLLLLFSQVITSLQTIKTLSIAGTLGKAGAVGLSVAGGVGLGVEGTRAIGRSTGNETLANADLGMLWKIIKTYTLGFLQKMTEFMDSFNNAVIFPLRNALSQLIVAIGGAALSIAGMVAKVFPAKGAEYEAAAQSLIDFGKQLQMSPERIEEANKANAEVNREFLKQAIKFLFPEVSVDAETGGLGGIPAGGEVELFNQDQIDAFAQFQEDMAEIERQGDEQRLRINEQYQDAVAAIEERLADMRKNIAKAEKDAAESEAKAEEDFQIRRGEIISDYNRNEIRAVQEFNRQRERDEQQHRYNLLDSAARLDAVAVIREMLSYNEKRKNAEDDRVFAKKQRADELQQRLEQEAEAHTRDMDELRENNREKLEEMRQQYREEEQAAQAKLIKLRDARDKELAVLDDKLARERKKREESYIEQFNSLAGSLKNQIEISRQGQADMEADLKKWWEDVRKDMEDAKNKNGDDKTTGNKPSDDYEPPKYAAGGMIPRDMLIQAHAGEEMIRSDIASQLRAAMGGTINQPALAMAMAGGGAGGVSIGNVTVGPIYGVPGQSPQDIGQAVVDKFKAIIKDYVGG